MDNQEQTTEQTTVTENRKPARKKLSSFTSTFNPAQAQQQATQGEAIVIAAPGTPEAQENKEEKTTEMQTPAIQTPEEQKIEAQPKKAQAQQQTQEAKEQKGNSVKEQKDKEVKETKEEKATEKMSIYLTPTERRQYRALMRKYEDNTERRLDENKFFRIILKSIKLETLDTSQPEQKQ